MCLTCPEPCNSKSLEWKDSKFAATVDLKEAPNLSQPWIYMNVTKVIELNVPQKGFFCISEVEGVLADHIFLGKLNPQNTPKNEYTLSRSTLFSAMY